MGLPCKTDVFELAEGSAETAHDHRLADHYLWRPNASWYGIKPVFNVLSLVLSMSPVIVLLACGVLPLYNRFSLLRGCL